MKNVVSMLSRDGAAGAAIDAHTPSRRQLAANELSKRLTYQSRAVLLNDALSRFFELCYERSGDILYNVDSESWRILVPTPWGIRYKSYGLRRIEAHVLRHLMMRMENAPVVYGRGPRSWYVNFEAFPALSSALGWVEAGLINGAVYAHAFQHYCALSKPPLAVRF